MREEDMGGWRVLWRSKKYWEDMGGWRVPRRIGEYRGRHGSTDEDR